MLIARLTLVYPPTPAAPRRPPTTLPPDGVPTITDHPARAADSGQMGAALYQYTTLLVSPGIESNTGETHSTTDHGLPSKQAQQGLRPDFDPVGAGVLANTINTKKSNIGIVGIFLVLLVLTLSGTPAGCWGGQRPEVARADGPDG